MNACLLHILYVKRLLQRYYSVHHLFLCTSYISYISYVSHVYYVFSPSATLRLCTSSLISIFHSPLTHSPTQAPPITQFSSIQLISVQFNSVPLGAIGSLRIRSKSVQSTPYPRNEVIRWEWGMVGLDVSGGIVVG